MAKSNQDALNQAKKTAEQAQANKAAQGGSNEPEKHSWDFYRDQAVVALNTAEKSLEAGIQFSIYAVCLAIRDQYLTGAKARQAAFAEDAKAKNAAFNDIMSSVFGYDMLDKNAEKPTDSRKKAFRRAIACAWYLTETYTEGANLEDRVSMPWNSGKETYLLTIHGSFVEKPDSAYRDSFLIITGTRGGHSVTDIEKAAKQRDNALKNPNAGSEQSKRQEQDEKRSKTYSTLSHGDKVSLVNSDLTGYETADKMPKSVQSEAKALHETLSGYFGETDTEAGSEIECAYDAFAIACEYLTSDAVEAWKQEPATVEYAEKLFNELKAVFEPAQASQANGKDKTQGKQAKAA